MNSIIKIAFFSMAMLAFHSGYSQGKQPDLGGLENKVIQDMAGNPNSSVMRTFNYNYDGVKGSPYFLEEFVEAKIVFNSGKEMRGVYANYDVHNDHLTVMRKKGGEILILEREFVKAFYLQEIGEDQYVHFFDSEVNGVKLAERNYFKVIHQGAFELYQVPGKIFKKANLDPTPYSGGQNFDQFIDKHTFYISYKEINREEVKVNRKFFTNLFPEIEKELKQYWKENDVSSKDPKSLKFLADYIERSLSKVKS